MLPLHFITDAKMCLTSRGGDEDTTFEAKDSEKNQGQGLGDTFENTRKYKCKHCNYDFISI